MKKSLKAILILLLFIPNYVLAYSDYIIASGENIGINIKTNGLLVVGTYKVNNQSLNTEIKAGDVITKVSNNDINSVTDLLNSIGECNNVNVEYKRNDRNFNTNINLKMENGICKTGLYVKDAISGIGTLTFIDPNTKLFGALGHEIIDNSTGKLVESNDGTIYNSEVINIQKSINNNPGEKVAKSNPEEVVGNIFENTNKGIFGNYTDNINNEDLYKVATSNEVKKGEAEIITVINKNEKKKYKINITDISTSDNTKNLVFEVVDQELLVKTGGIVQGMSGSPIIQEGKIIGAVTHVVVNNPSKGYGIFITNMLNEAEN